MSDLRQAADTLQQALTGPAWRRALARLSRDRLLALRDALLVLLEIVLDAEKDTEATLQARGQASLALVGEECDDDGDTGHDAD